MYTHDISRAFGEILGEDGADKKYFSAAQSTAAKALAALKADKTHGIWPIISAASQTDDLDAIEQEARRITDKAATLVVLGMGGSSLGGKALAALCPSGAVHFVDNIDPFTFEALIAGLDFKATHFLIISKSGNTAETLAQMLILLHETERRISKEALRDHFLAITMQGDNALRRLAKVHSIRVLDHATDIGGRFAALTLVGLLPAKVAGLDIRAVRKGAAEIVRRTVAEPAAEPIRGAALHHALHARGKTLSVLMPYCDRLHVFTDWYRQLWAESLGKKGKGTTPLRALGASDQHSQLQLYLDGPRDKFFTFLLLAQAEKGASIPEPSDASLAYLRGQTLGDLMDAEQRATAETLTRNHCPVRLFTLAKLDGEVMGALMMHFMLETIITAQLWQVDAFDQPAVEQSKQLARTYLMASR